MASYKTVCVIVTGFILWGTSALHAAQVLFTPTLNLSEEYTDNLFLSSDNEVDDFTTRLGLGLTGRVLWRTAGVELNYTPTYNKYADNSDFDYWRHSASFYTWKAFKRNTRLELRNTFLQTNDPVDQTDAIDPDNPLRGSAIETDFNRRGRNEYLTNVADLRLTHQFGTNDSVYLSHNYRLLRDVDTFAGVPVDDNDIHTTSAGVAYSFTPRWTMELDAFYRNSTYESTNDREQYNGEARLLYNFDRNMSAFVAYRHTALMYDEDIDEDFQVYRPLVGFEKRFQGNARISIGLGYYVQDFETSDDESSFIATSEIYKRWDFRPAYFDILATSGYDIDDLGVQDNGLRLYYSGRAELGYSFTSRLSASIYGSYRYTEYPNAVPDRADNNLLAGMGVGWQVLQWMSARLTYDYRSLTSDLDSAEYTENRVLLLVTVAPVNPYRLN